MKNIRLLDSIEELNLSPSTIEYLNKLRIYYIYELMNNDPRFFKSRGIQIKDRVVDEIIDSCFQNKIKFVTSMTETEREEFYTTLNNIISSKKYKYIDDISIDILTLSPKTYMALKKANMTYISKIVKLDKYELCLVKGLGIIGVENIKEELHKLGLKIKGESFADDNVVLKFNTEIPIKDKCLDKISRIDRGYSIMKKIESTEDCQLERIKRVIKKLDSQYNETEINQINDILNDKESSLQLQMLRYVSRILTYLKDEECSNQVEECFSTLEEIAKIKSKKMKY